MQVAQTILAQFGGNRFVAMTGAKNFVGSPNSLRFNIPTRSGPNVVVVTLEPSDTYRVDFYRVRGVKCTQVAQCQDVYAEQLQAVFTEKTGLFTLL
jgi:hypothetical protein